MGNSFPVTTSDVRLCMTPTGSGVYGWLLAFASPPPSSCSGGSLLASQLRLFPDEALEIHAVSASAPSNMMVFGQVPRSQIATYLSRPSTGSSIHIRSWPYPVATPLYAGAHSLYSGLHDAGLRFRSIADFDDVRVWKDGDAHVGDDAAMRFSCEREPCAPAFNDFPAPERWYEYNSASEFVPMTNGQLWAKTRHLMAGHGYRIELRATGSAATLIWQRPAPYAKPRL